MIYHILKSIISQKLGIVAYPYFATYFVTKKCNLKCVFCHIWKNQHTADKELAPNEIKKLFSKLHRIDVLRISGGEPFLRKDLPEVINSIDKTASPHMIHITTNGTLTNKTVKCLQEVENPKKIHIKVSIDGIGERHDELRGVSGAYKKAVNTVKELIGLRSHLDFHLGINQAIVNESDVDSYYRLKYMFSRNRVPVYPVIANHPTNALYSNKKIVSPERSVEPFGSFSSESLIKFMHQLIRDAGKITNIREKIVDRYHLKGLRNRLLFNLKTPNPRCVALTNHIRILPNGDVPVCLFNGTIVGNLLRQPFNELWYKNDKIDKQRDWVNKCSGCWQSCESIVSAIYTGDIWRGVF